MDGWMVWRWICKNTYVCTYMWISKIICVDIYVDVRFGSNNIFIGA